MQCCHFYIFKVHFHSWLCNVPSFSPSRTLCPFVWMQIWAGSYFSLPRVTVWPVTWELYPMQGMSLCKCREVYPYVGSFIVCTVEPLTVSGIKVITPQGAGRWLLLHWQGEVLRQHNTAVLLCHSPVSRCIGCGLLWHLLHCQDEWRRICWWVREGEWQVEVNWVRPASLEHKCLERHRGIPFQNSFLCSLALWNMWKYGWVFLVVFLLLQQKQTPGTVWMCVFN